ncbi:MAG: alpha/beta hydrolase [Gammaproteobacteria bacterium]|nr:alpha/beta hydrolase [Gammaproteobacteria bacterium]
MTALPSSCRVLFTALLTLLCQPLLGAASDPPATTIAYIPAQVTPAALPQPMAAHEGFVDVGDTRLWYRDTGGAGETILLLHPFSGSAAVFAYQESALAAEGYRVVAYSRRGHFQSGIGDPDHPAPGVSDLMKLLEHLQIDRFHLVGFAAGANIVPDFAIASPQRLLSIAIGCTIGQPGDPAYAASNATLLPAELMALPVWLKELSPAYRAANSAGAARWRELNETSSSRRVAVPLLNDITPERLAAIDLPVLLFTGDSDFYMPPSRLAAYARYWRAPEVVVFSEAGHAVYWEQPEAFNATLLRFLRLHPDTGAQ